MLTIGGGSPRTLETPGGPTPGDPRATCPVTVGCLSQWHRWSDLTFLHWAFDPEVVQRLLPAGLEVDTIAGAAWVGLVPFHMTLTLPGRGPVPWVSRFLETNVRTYVRAADGSVGIWFFSLDAARLGAVATARASWGLPYFWSSMRHSHLGDVVTYECRRRLPGPGAASRVAIVAGAPLERDELGNLDHWLTARWRLFRATSSSVWATVAEHEPWPLHRAEILHCDDGLLAAAGLPATTADPIAHWSPGVDVRIGFPRRVGGIRTV